MNPKFSVNVGGPEYSAGWERIFGPKVEHVIPLTVESPWDKYTSVDRVTELFQPVTFEQIKADLEQLCAPVRLRDYQRRQMAWAEHNFPLKPSLEHTRMACEFLTRNEVDVDTAIVDNLAYLLASRDHRSYRPLLGVVEEVGELCHAHLKNEQGIRGTPEEWRTKKQDAIGDILIYLLDYCTREELDAEECLETAWAEVSARDWIRFPKNGKTE